MSIGGKVSSNGGKRLSIGGKLLSVGDKPFASWNSRDEHSRFARYSLSCYNEWISNIEEYGVFMKGEDPTVAFEKEEVQRKQGRSLNICIPRLSRHCL